MKKTESNSQDVVFDQIDAPIVLKNDDFEKNNDQKTLKIESTIPTNNKQIYSPINQIDLKNTPQCNEKQKTMYSLPTKLKISPGYQSNVRQTSKRYNNQQYQAHPHQLPSKYIYKQQTQPRVIIVREKINDNEMVDGAVCACLSGMMTALCCCLICH